MRGPGIRGERLSAPIVPASTGDGRRLHRLCLRAVRDFRLELKGARVLTEAASGAFVVTPLLAAVAGADVDAVVRDSRYGRAADVITRTRELAEAWDVGDRILCHPRLESETIGRADIVTNLGFVRPIDRTFVSRLKPSAVIPLMWETWEYREEDLDLAACRERGVAVLGTNEADARVGTLDDVGRLSVKLLREAGVEIRGSRIAVVGGGVFREKIRGALSRLGSDPDVDRFPDETDAVLIAEHHRKELLIGDGGRVRLPADWWKGRKVIHLCGRIDADWLKQAGAEVTPGSPAPFGRMSFTTGHLGPGPVIRLHAAGLKVGEAMWRGRRQGLRGTEFLRGVMSQAPAMNFPDDLACL